MNTKPDKNYLSHDEIALHRMSCFHRESVGSVVNGSSLLTKSVNGVLVIHLIPQNSVMNQTRIEAAQLEKYGNRIPLIGGYTAQSRFNVDGYLNHSSRADNVRAYTQVFRDGRLEAVGTNISYPVDERNENSPLALRDGFLEHQVFEIIKCYFSFCNSLNIEQPIWMYSALIDCEGIGICNDRAFRELSEFSIDRSPAYLPEIKLDPSDCNSIKGIQLWCDYLWQSVGFERSFSFDNDGNWRERR